MQLKFLNAVNEEINKQLRIHSCYQGYNQHADIILIYPLGKYSLLATSSEIFMAIFITISKKQIL
jgi:hypothetical protein